MNIGKWAEVEIINNIRDNCKKLGCQLLLGIKTKEEIITKYEKTIKTFLDLDKEVQFKGRIRYDFWRYKDDSQNIEKTDCRRYFLNLWEVDNKLKTLNLHHSYFFGYNWGKIPTEEERKRRNKLLKECFPGLKRRPWQEMDPKIKKNKFNNSERKWLEHLRGKSATYNSNDIQQDHILDRAFFRLCDLLDLEIGKIKEKHPNNIQNTSRLVNIAKISPDSYKNYLCCIYNNFLELKLLNYRGVYHYAPAFDITEKEMVKFNEKISGFKDHILDRATEFFVLRFTRRNSTTPERKNLNIVTKYCIVT